MSGGMRKRATLAQTLIRNPDIILMDEPFSALDIQTRQQMEMRLGNLDESTQGLAFYYS
ncbi:Glycine betaine/proline betaine transport system ATP-binding protein ProV [Oligella ureolytica]